MNGWDVLLVIEQVIRSLPGRVLVFYRRVHGDLPWWMPCKWCRWGMVAAVLSIIILFAVKGDGAIP